MNLYFKAGSALNQHQLMCPTSTTKKKILSKVGVKLYACFVCCRFFNVDYIFFTGAFLDQTQDQHSGCNRYVEAVMSKLCQIFPSSKRNDEGIKVDRWTLIGRNYEHICQCILKNAQVMENTTIQLPSINKNHLNPMVRNFQLMKFFCIEYT